MRADGTAYFAWEKYAVASNVQKPAAGRLLIRSLEMRLAYVALAALLSPFTSTCGAADWKVFDDPRAFLLTDAFAKSINSLSAPEKVAAIKRLQESLKAKEVEIRRRAVLTLASLGDRSGVPTMIKDLATATGKDRDNIVVALRVLRDKRATAALRKVLKDKSPHVRGIAVAALGELKAAEAFKEIVALTKDKEGLAAGKDGGRLNCIRNCPAFLACYALGALGDQRAVPVLIELLPDADLRGPARQALEVLTKQKFGNDPDKWRAWWRSKSLASRPGSTR
jgi:HEAT repeat protein